MKESKTIIIGIMVAVLALFSQQAEAQYTKSSRSGFSIGVSGGVGVLHFTKGMDADETSSGIALPVKMGWFLKNNLAVYVNLSGQIYEADGLDRSFEGIIPTIQYWPSDRLWLSGGFGPSLDTRALYESKTEAQKTDWGKGLLLSTGYEFLQKANWALDIQTQLLMASVSREGLDNLEGASFTLSLGFTLY